MQAIFDAILKVSGAPPSQWTSLTAKRENLNKSEIDFSRLAEIERLMRSP